MFLIKISNFSRNCICFSFRVSIDQRLKFSNAQKRCPVFSVFPFFFFSHRFKKHIIKTFRVFILLKVQEILQQEYQHLLDNTWPNSVWDPSHVRPMVCCKILLMGPLSNIRYQPYALFWTFLSHLVSLPKKLLLFWQTWWWKDFLG